MTSRRRTDIDARAVRLGRLEREEASKLIDALAESNARLKATGPAERQKLYEATAGNPLLLHWTVGQLGRRGSQCRTVEEACGFLQQAPADNDPLEYIFGDLVDTFTESETSVLATLAHFTLPAEVQWIIDVAGLNERQAQVALEDLADRALIEGDPGASVFVIPPLAATYLRHKRPEAIARTGDRLVERVVALCLENGFEEHERFPVLEAAWSTVAAALPLVLASDNARLQHVCEALTFFLDFSGRWDDRLWLLQEAEARAATAADFHKAGWLAYQAGRTYSLQGQVPFVLACADRAANHWEKAGAGAWERSITLRLRGIAHRLEKRYPAAIDAHSLSLTLSRSIALESDDMTISLSFRADAELQSGDLASAERDYREALRIATKIHYQEGIACFKGNLAELAIARENWPAAETLARESLALAEALGRQELIGANCRNLAKALARQGKPSEGLPYAQRATDIFSKLKKPGALTEAQTTLRECIGPGSPSAGEP